MEKEKLFSAVTIMTPVIYKDFYKLYYKERLKVFRFVATVIAIAAIIGGLYMYYNNFPLMWSVIALWIGAFLLFYPHVAYRKPYKKARDAKQTTRFAFYETYVGEKISSNETDYNYSELMKVIETDKYFFIFHSIESISIVDKESVKGGSEELAEFLKLKVPAYKRVK
ncbi:MAG: YcxB family protein [Oscillospiraceae bacterium]|nr:YcxB family protein [Oscillospiraceae bacterium]